MKTVEALDALKRASVTSFHGDAPWFAHKNPLRETTGRLSLSGRWSWRETVAADPAEGVEVGFVFSRGQRVAALRLTDDRSEVVARVAHDWETWEDEDEIQEVRLLLAAGFPLELQHPPRKPDSPPRLGSPRRTGWGRSGD